MAPKHADLLSRGAFAEPWSFHPSDHVPIGCVLRAATPRVVQAIAPARHAALKQQWLALKDKAPPRCKGRPGPETLRLLKAHANKVREWVTSLETEQEREFAKGLKKGKR